jgi:hypothetical protein
LEVPVQDNRLPRSRTCLRAIAFLEGKKKRDEFRQGIAKRLAVMVAPGRGLVVATPLPNPRAREAQPKGLQQPLFRVVAVADQHRSCCFIVGRRLLDGTPALTAFVLQVHGPTRCSCGVAMERGHGSKKEDSGGRERKL